MAEHEPLLPAPSPQTYTSLRHDSASAHSSHDGAAHRHNTPDPSAAYATRKLWFASALCLVFFLVELVGGILSNSLAILSDSFHLLSDLSGFLISLFAIYIGQQKATKRHSFGFHRAEVLGALLSVAMIWVVTAFLVAEAIDRVQNPKPINGPIMLGIAVIGLIVNIILIFALGHGHAHSHGDEEEAGHSHGHGHGHQHNINLKAAVLHIIGDIVSSVGVLVSSIIVTVKPDWVIVDPICTFFFSIIVIFTTLRLSVDSISVLMEGTPTHIDPHAVERDLRALPHVVAVHDLHIWTLTVGKAALAVHIEVPDLTNHQQVLHDAQDLLCRRYNVHHTTIQLEVHTRNAHCVSALCNGGVCPGALLAPVVDVVDEPASAASSPTPPPLAPSTK